MKQSGKIRCALPLDPTITRAVKILVEAGVETYESCQDERGHSNPEPTIRFCGERYKGFRALAVAMAEGLPVKSICRIWHVRDGEPVRPDWEMTFWNEESL
jgi:hypothetical protein